MQRHPGFQISMRYSPFLTAFEVWVSYVDLDGDVQMLVPMFSDVGSTKLADAHWNKHKPHTSVSPSFLIAPEETYDLAQELHRYGPFKPDKPEPDVARVDWLQKMLERVIDFKSGP